MDIMGDNEGRGVMDQSMILRSKVFISFLCTVFCASFFYHIKINGPGQCGTRKPGFIVKDNNGGHWTILKLNVPHLGLK